MTRVSDSGSKDDAKTKPALNVSLPLIRPPAPHNNDLELALEQATLKIIRRKEQPERIRDWSEQFVALADLYHSVDAALLCISDMDSALRPALLAKLLRYFDKEIDEDFLPNAFEVIGALRDIETRWEESSWTITTWIAHRTSLTIKDDPVWYAPWNRRPAGFKEHALHLPSIPVALKRGRKRLSADMASFWRIAGKLKGESRETIGKSLKSARMRAVLNDLRGDVRLLEERLYELRASVAAILCWIDEDSKHPGRSPGKQRKNQKLQIKIAGSNKQFRLWIDGQEIHTTRWSDGRIEMVTNVVTMGYFDASGNDNCRAKASKLAKEYPNHFEYKGAKLVVSKGVTILNSEI